MFGEKSKKSFFEVSWVEDWKGSLDPEGFEYPIGSSDFTILLNMNPSRVLLLICFSGRVK